MLQIKHISKEYRTGDLVQHALNDVSLNFRDNEFVAILGPSGSGKTTLLNVIREQGGRVLDCDEIYHQQLKQDLSLLRAIEDRFPGVVEQGTLNRKKLGNIVFADKSAGIL